MTDHAEPPSTRGARPGQDLAEELRELGYLELFQRADSTALEQIWRAPGARERLRQLALDNGPPSLPAFLASEVLFARDEEFPERSDRGALATLYAAALSRNMAGMANPWGLPGELDGPVASHVLSLGDAAVPAFAALMDDETPLRFGGSKEATVGNAYSYRVKDVAASLLAGLLGLPFQAHLDRRERDVEIDSLRTRIP